MDIARPSNARQRLIRRSLYAAAGLLVVVLATVALSRLKPSVPVIDAATILADSVKRGPMVREVRGLGTLVPEDIRWIPSATQGRVERILLRPGTEVTAASVILDLSNTELDQELQDTQLRLGGAEASLANLRVQAGNEALAQEAATANIEAEYKKATLQLEADQQLAGKGLVSAMTLKQAQLEADQLAARYAIAQKQLASYGESTRARLAVQQSEVDQARAFVRLKQRQVNDLHVRAGLDGVLQIVPVDVGQQVAPGTNLARVANPSRLKAELKIAETQAKDVQIGQLASIDTHNGLVRGRVTRIDPSVQNGTRTVDVSLEGPLPNGAVPDLSVDGTIELERLNDVLFTGRPAFGQEQSTVTVFKMDKTGAATRVQVKLGRSSVNSMEILSGLNVGDRVILSDMSAWDAYDRVSVK